MTPCCLLEGTAGIERKGNIQTKTTQICHSHLTSQLPIYFQMNFSNLSHSAFQESTLNPIFKALTMKTLLYHGQ